MFKSELIVGRIIGVNDCWILKAPLTYTSPRINITIPEGFIFDFASVPKFLQAMFRKAGAKYDRASCLHDYLYATKLVDRKTADIIFYEAMLSDKVNKTQAWLFYKSVRMFGSKHYKEGEKLDPAKIKTKQ